MSPPFQHSVDVRKAPKIFKDKTRPTSFQTTEQLSPTLTPQVRGGERGCTESRHRISEREAKQHLAERWELPNLSPGWGYPSLTPGCAARAGKPPRTAPPGAPSEAAAQRYVSLSLGAFLLRAALLEPQPPSIPAGPSAHSAPASARGAHRAREPRTDKAWAALQLKIQLTKRKRRKKEFSYLITRPSYYFFSQAGESAVRAGSAPPPGEAAPRAERQAGGREGGRDGGRGGAAGPGLVTDSPSGLLRATLHRWTIKK